MSKLSTTFAATLISLFCLGFTGTSDISASTATYERNPYVTEELWNYLTPHFLPADSPLREALDSIFSKKRVLSSTSAMRKADFLIISPKDKIIVARHHKLRGYLIKAYLDTQDVEEWYWWKKRVDGSNLIRQAIMDYDYGAFMKAPEKWIYPLPPEPSPKAGNSRRNFILVVEDVRPYNQKKNREAYKSQMTEEKLTALYRLMTENLLIDSVYPDNTPFCKDGKIAFLDTEHSQDHTRPVPLSIVGNYLSKEMKEIWEQLIVHGLPRE